MATAPAICWAVWMVSGNDPARKFFAAAISLSAGISTRIRLSWRSISATALSVTTVRTSALASNAPVPRGRLKPE